MAHGFQKPTSSPRISLSGGRATYVGPGLDLAPHRNMAATIAVALDSPFLLRFLDDGAGDATHHIALIPPGAMHHLRASGNMGFLYLDAMSDDFTHLSVADLSSLQASVVTRLLADPGVIDVDALCRCLGVRARPAPDARIAAVVRQIDAAPQVIDTIATAAGIAGISPSRFQSLFRRTVGMPFRRYRLWRRMAIVLQAVSRGETLTNAAIDAGFASSSHLSATFRAMFGLTPSSLIARGIRIEGRD